MSDTPTPAEVGVTAVAVREHFTDPMYRDDYYCCARDVLAALAAAGLRVVAVPDGLPERLREIAAYLEHHEDDAADLRAAAALLGGEEP